MSYIARSIFPSFTNLPEGAMRTQESRDDRRNIPITACVPATFAWYGDTPTTGVAGSIC